MSKEKGAAKQSLSSEGTRTGTNTANLEQHQQHPQQHQVATPSLSAHQQQAKDGAATTSYAAPTAGTEQKSASMEAPSVATGAPVAEESAPTEAASTAADSEEPPRQMIAVSASKSPAAFFNLARKFLVTNEMCDLSALEGAIVSAVDAAHLLERSQLATIVRIHTSYVSVEPKRKKQASPQGEQDVVLVQASPDVSTGGGEVSAAATSVSNEQPTTETRTTRAEEPVGSSASSVSASAGTASPQPSRRGASGGRELRRARIIVTVRRTESYKRWLEENPLQAIIASEAEDEGMESEEGPTSRGRPKKP